MYYDTLDTATHSGCACRGDAEELSPGIGEEEEEEEEEVISDSSCSELEEVQYSDGSSNGVDADDSAAESDDDEEACTCGECGKTEEDGRKDSDGDFYCLGCWAEFEGNREGADEEAATSVAADDSLTDSDEDEEAWTCGECGETGGEGREDSEGEFYCLRCWEAFEEGNDDELRREHEAARSPPQTHAGEAGEQEEGASKPSDETKKLLQNVQNAARYQSKARPAKVLEAKREVAVRAATSDAALAASAHALLRQLQREQNKHPHQLPQPSTPADEDGPNTKMAEKRRREVSVRKRCSSCNAFEMGGNTGSRGEHYCDWCWSEHPGAVNEEPEDTWDEGRTAVPKGDSLPIEDFRAEIVRSIRVNTVTSILGETGCGKSSMVPQFILDDCHARGTRARVLVTQPRRIAAITLARRVAHQRAQRVGRLVGYRVGNRDHKCSKGTQITFCTVGYLLAYLSHNPQKISEYTHLVLDEVHERSVDADLLNYLVKKLMEKNSVKVIIMSATLQLDVFGRYFTPPGEVVQDAIFVGVRRFPVQQIFLDTLAEDIPGVADGLVSKVAAGFLEANVAPKFSNDAKKLVVQCAQAVAAVGSTVLVFLPGMDEICAVQEEIEKRVLLNTAVHVLHSQISQEDQDAALEPPPEGECKIILSTNIAESSITIPEVEVIIDSCLVRGLFYDEQRKIQCLRSKWCSRASVKQRAGRAGRVKEGVIIHLIPSGFHERGLSDFDEAEISRTPLTKTVLNVKLLFQEFGSPSQVLRQFMSPPKASRVRDAIEQLYRVGATTANSEDAEVTALGETATRLPVDLPLCKLITLGASMGALNAAIIMAAALSQQDVFGMPMALFLKDTKEFTKEIAANFASRSRFDAGQFSEPLMYLRVYRAWLASSRDQYWCKRNRINMVRMKMMDSCVSTLASSSTHLLQQHGLIPDLLDKLEESASKRNHGRTLDKEAQVIVQDGDSSILYCMLAGAFSPLFLVTDGSTEQDVKHDGFDPRKTLVLADITPKEASMQNILQALGAQLKHADIGAEHAILSELPSVIGGKRGKSKKLLGATASSLVLSSADGTGIAQQLQQITVSKSRELSGGQLLIELDGPVLEASDPRKTMPKITEDACFAVKLLLQLWKQSRGKLRIPNPRFVVGGDDPEHFTIARIISGRRLNWRPCFSFGAQMDQETMASPSSRQPVWQMSDFVRSNASRFATTFSLVGNDNPKNVNAEGMTVLPRGPFSSFLLLAFFLQGHGNVQFLGRRDKRGDLSFEAAVCNNVYINIAGRFDVAQLNFFRHFVSKAIAGQSVSQEDRRRGKKLLAAIIAVRLSDHIQTGAKIQKEGKMEWMQCSQDGASNDYFPPLLLEDADQHRSEDFPDLGLDQTTSSYNTNVQMPHHQNSAMDRHIANLNRIVGATVMPVLSSRRMPLHELNSIILQILSRKDVFRAAKNIHDSVASDCCVLSTFLDSRPDLILKAIISTDMQEGEVVVSTAEFEEKQTEGEELLVVDVCSDHLAAALDKESDYLTEIPTSNAAPQVKLGERVASTAIDQGIQSCLEKAILVDENVTHEQQAEPSIPCDLRVFHTDISRSRRRQRVSAQNDAISKGNLMSREELRAGEPSPLSDEDPKDDSMPMRLQTLETFLITLLNQNGDMTVSAINKALFKDTRMKLLCQQLLSDYDKKNAVLKGTKGGLKRVRENPFDADGSIKESFLVNRKAIFIKNWSSSINKKKKSSETSFSLAARSAECEVRAAQVKGSNDSSQKHALQTQDSDSKVDAQETHRSQKVDSPEAPDAGVRGIHLANGWQEWTLPDGKKYYHHPGRQVSLWDLPADAQDRSACAFSGNKRPKQSAVAGPGHGAPHFDKKKCLHVLEFSISKLLENGELELSKLIQAVDDDPSIQVLVKQLCDYRKTIRGRDLGVDPKNGKLTPYFFDTRPLLFQKRAHQGCVFVSAIRQGSTTKGKAPRTGLKTEGQATQSAVSAGQEPKIGETANESGLTAKAKRAEGKELGQAKTAGSASRQSRGRKRS